MRPSTISAVPSGEPSSTTSVSSLESWARTVSINRAMFSRSLYVGTMTRARPTSEWSAPSDCIVLPRTGESISPQDEDLVSSVVLHDREAADRIEEDPTGNAPTGNRVPLAREARVELAVEKRRGDDE